MAEQNEGFVFKTREEFNKLSLVERLVYVRGAKSYLTNMAESYETLEQNIKGELLAMLDQRQEDSFKKDGYTVSRTKTITVALGTEPEVAYRTMYDQMTQAQKEGRPLGDASLLQQRAHKTAVMDLVLAEVEKLRAAAGQPPLGDVKKLDPDDSQVVECAAKLGFRLLRKVDVSIRKSTKA